VKQEDGCPHCENPATELNVEKGYAVLWDEVHTEMVKLMADGMSADEAFTLAVNKFLTWVTGSDICKVKSQAYILRKFWELFGKNEGVSPLRARVDKTIHDLVEFMKVSYPNAWKCFIGEQDYEKHVKGYHGEK